MTYNAEMVPDLLGPGGPFVDALERYEDRPYQREMALEVARLLEDGGRVAIEAPTGIGKSLGYGLPAALWAKDGNGPVVISTHTKALQEQLLEIEGPRLRRAVGGHLDVGILKGRANYLCRRRFEALTAEASGEGSVALLRRIRPWALATQDGDLGHAGERNPRDLQFLHARAASESRFCAHTACTPATGCFFKMAKARAGGVDLLVVNHALLATHLFGGRDVLPDITALVIDEAHAFVRVALDHLSTSVGVARLLTILELGPGSRGWIPDALRTAEGTPYLGGLHMALSSADHAAHEFFGKRNGTRPAGDSRQRYRDAGELRSVSPLPEDPLCEALDVAVDRARALEDFLRRQGDRGEGESVLATDLARLREGIEAFRDDLLDLVSTEGRDRVAWKEWHRDETFTLNASPLEAGPSISRALAEGPERVVFTSATLAAGKDFSFFSREAGQDGALATIAYPSPFDHAAQALAVAVQSGPDPRDPGWAEATAGTIDALLVDPGRKTLALFTSYRDLQAVRASLSRGNPAYELFVQGEGGTAADLLPAFRAADRALLLGTASFWEGIDLPGDALEVLVLTRLPFGVPTDPRLAARSERLEAEGGNPFLDLYLPEALLRFKQGIGRLIRRRTDRGIVAVLDTRLLAKSYGKRFRDVLPLPVTPVKDGDALARKAAAWWRERGA